MTDENKKYISTCPKCEEMYPTIVFTCNNCHTEVAYAKGYSIITPNTYYCYECCKKKEELVWKYQQAPLPY